MEEFLMHLGDAAKSTIALVAYVVVIVAWSLRAWLKDQPQRKAEKILAQYGSDAKRTIALKALLGTDPPKGMKKEDILLWVKLQTRYRSRFLLAVAYLSTLVAVVVIVGMALFYPQNTDKVMPPVLIESTVQRPEGNSP